MHLIGQQMPQVRLVRHTLLYTYCWSIGVSRSSLTRIIEESHQEESFTSPAKCYKSSREKVVTDSFDRDAIRRKIYDMYEHKQHVTLSNLLVY